MATKERRESAKHSKFLRFLQRPFKYLIKARDLYINSMIKCSGKLDSDVGLGCPAGQVPPILPNCYSVSSAISSRGCQDYSDLVRVASERSLGSKFDHLGVIYGNQKRKYLVKEPAGFHRSLSVGIGRIDEENSCELVERATIKTDIWQRSRSYSASRSGF